MKAIKHFTILILALCCSYFANAQCPTAFSYTATGNSITATSTNAFGNQYLFAWYLNGYLFSGPGLDTTYTFQNISPGTYDICYHASQANTGALCDSVCRSITVYNCDTFAAYITGGSATLCPGSSSAPIVAHAYGGHGASTYQWYNNAGLITGATDSSYTPGPLTATNSYTCHVTNATCGLYVSSAFNVFVTGPLTAQWTYSAGGGDTINFFAYDTNTSAHHIWNFGDGTNGSGTTVSHVYSGPGSYHVCFYTYIPGSSCTDSLCETVTVTANPACGTASFSAYILNDSTIRGYSTSTGTSDSTTYVWNVYSSTGNLLQSTSTGHTSYFLSNPMPIGTYRVCLSLYSSLNVQVLCSTACDTINVLRCSSLNNTWHYTTTTTSDSAKFTIPTNAPSGSTFIWTFGDGTSSTTSPAVTHVYSQAGTYTACLITSNPALTCRDTLCQNIVVGNPNACGTASFSVYILNDSTIRGYGTSTGTNDSSTYVWTVTNQAGTVVQTSNTGHTSNFLSNPMPIGTYRVCLSLYNTGLALCSSACDTVNVLRCSSLTAAWQTNGNTGSSDTVHFYNSTNPTGTVYAWTFGDGTTSSSSNPTHIYTQSGVYTVCLIVSNPALTCKDTLCQSVTAGNPNACGVASFLYYVTSDSLIRAYSNSTGTSDSSSYVWTVTGNVGGLPVTQTISTGHVNNLTTGALAIGTYTVCLKLYNAQGIFCDSSCQSVQILRCSSLIDSWTFTTSTTNDSLKVYGSGNNPTGTTFAWTFGDGTNASSTVYHNTHVYSQAGVYTVCLVVSNPALNCRDTLCQSVTIGNPNACGTAAFEYYVLNDSTIRGYSTSTGTTDSTSYVWVVKSNVGGLPVTQTFSTGHVNNFLSGGVPIGTYTVCLELFNAQGTYCDSTCQTIQVLRCSSLNPQWTYASSTTNDSLKVTAPTNNPTGTTYAWTFGDGTTSSYPNLTHVYSAAGTYTVCLIVSNPALTCHDTLCQSITVGNPTACPVAGVDDYIYGDTSIHIYSTSTGISNTTYYQYSVRNASGTLVYSTSGSALTFVVTPALPNGVYTVCLSVAFSSTAHICDSVCVSATVGNVCPVASFSDYIYGDTSIHVYSTSTGTTTSTYYGYSVRNANGVRVFADYGPNITFVSTPTLAPGAYTVCLSVALSANVPACDSVCSTVVIPIVGACGTAAFADTVYPGLGGGAIHAYTTSTNVDSMSQYSWKIWGPNGNLVQTFTGGDFTSSTLDTGVYTVCQYIRATAETTICDSLCQTIVVGGGINPCAGMSAAWTYNIQSNTSDSIEFHGPNEPAGTYYYWSFGDGTHSSAQNLIHGYAQSGTYTVCLIAYRSGCSDTSCQSVVIVTTAPCPVAAFSEYVYGDTSIHAYSTTTGATANTSYYWTVATTSGVQVATGSGHGTSASFISPALPNGTYNVCLYVGAVAGANFCNYVCHSITITDTVNPCAGLNANFTETTLQNGNEQFTATDTGSGVNHYWHFGDGTILNTTSPTTTHAYNAAGTYHVCQYVYYTGNTSCLDSFCTNITVHASGCNAGFTYSNYYPPYNGVQFTSTSTSTDSIISYRWYFGDSTTATFKSGDHIFPHSGKWYVCLYIYAANGCTSSYCDSVNVQYNACAGLSANYTYTYTQGGGVHFVGSTAIASVTNYWTFGDGTTATTFDPVHYYTQPGTYTVCHIVSIPGTLCSDTSCQSVQGTNTGTGCVANFKDSISGYEANITNLSTSTDSIVSEVWSFGDGVTISNITPRIYHIYANPGTYNVCLTITSANGCTNTYCDSAHIGTNTPPACHASFTYTVDSCQVITFTSTSTGSLDFLRWIYGDGTTDTTYHPTHHYAQGGNYTVILHFYGNGCYNFDTAVISVPSCSAPGDTVCGFVFDDLNGNGVQNTGEPGIPNAEVHVGSYVTHADSTGHYVIVVPAGSYTIYYCAPAGYSFTIPVHTPLDSTNTSTCAAYQNIQVTSGQNCGYNFGILTNTVTICGTVYFDANDNHAQDNNESGIPNAKVVFTENGVVVYTGYTDQYGHYCAVLPVGSYVITASSSTYPNGLVYPASITVTATAPGGSYDNNNFGIYVQPTGCDLDIQITPNTTVTPGYPAWYQIEVCNVGTSVTSGTVNLFYDPTLIYNYSSPAATSQNSTTFTASWNLAGLNPGSCQYYYVSLTADTNLTAGYFIFTLANVTTDGCTDINPGNNVDTLHQNVTASWDPNNKQVSPAGEGPEGLINYNQWLTYTINFQNTGTAPAVNIVVQDTLSQWLDLTTFKMLGASLPYTMQFSGNTAIWKFNAVSLPDSSTDQQGSHGFISFMILPVANVPTKTVITNQADIFFDYNAGVATNRTLNTIDYSLSVNNIAGSNVTITLQPNPFGQYTTIKVDGAEGPYELNVYDMLGRVVKNQTAAGNVFSIDRGSLASGMYTYELIHNGTVIGKGKMIAQ